LSDSGLELVALPFSRVELEGIAALYPAAARRLVVGAGATEDTVKRAALGGYRYLHFAAHAYVNDTRPGRSGIVLVMNPRAKEDGVLQASEVMTLDLNADLVTLSACSTGLGKMLRGEGILGLVQAFFYAGARSVTASLWNVNDAATATLMRGFYSGLRGNMPRDAALRRAKLRLARSADPHLNDPYYWAPFVLVGSVK
jgi:CHAT domain-containing protein